MRRLTLPLIGFIIAFSYVVYRINSKPITAFPKEAYVTSIIDGDTIQLSRSIILRYIGIDTPELGYRGDNGTYQYDPEPFAVEAKVFNEQNLLGKKIIIEYDRVRSDAHKRILGYVFINNECINERLLSEGLGFLMLVEKDLKYADRFHQAVKESKKNNKGLWNMTGVPYVADKDAGQYIRKRAQVEGVIYRVTKHKKVVFINFDPDEKKDFTGVIFSQTFNAFKEFNNLELEKNKHVRIFGIIKEYNGPEIIINSPEQIEIIQHINQRLSD